MIAHTTQHKPVIPETVGHHPIVVVRRLRGFNQHNGVLLHRLRTDATAAKQKQQHHTECQFFHFSNFSVLFIFYFSIS